MWKGSKKRTAQQNRKNDPVGFELNRIRSCIVETACSAYGGGGGGGGAIFSGPGPLEPRPRLITRHAPGSLMNG